VAGITLNADLILNGQLPLVDNVEYKAPGTFYLTAGIWSVFGRSMDTLQTTAKYWSILSMLGIFWTGFLLYGRRAGCIAAFIYVLVSPVTDSIDANYGAWMIAPYVWATGALLWSAKTGRLRYLILAGVLLAIAGLLKRQAAVLFPIFALIPLLHRWANWPEHWLGFGDARKAVIALFSGLGVGFAPIMIWYASQGALVPFVKSYFFSESGWKYVKGDAELWDQTLRIGDGFLGFAEYIATPTLLATVAIFMVVRPGSPLTARGVFLAAHLGMSFIGAALGLRFFKGYYLQTLPALVWISAHPRGPISVWFQLDLWASWKDKFKTSLLALGAFMVVFPALLHDGMAVNEIRTRRETPRDLTAQSISRVIRENTASTDEIWVWGRWAWPVYFHADRRPATDFPKTLSVFTTNLTNTWRRPTKNTGFIDDSPWPILMEQLTQERPKFIVLSHNENYHKFKALRDFLRREYRAVSMNARGFSVYGLKGRTVNVPDALKRSRAQRKRKARKKNLRRRGRSSQPKKNRVRKTQKRLETGSHTATPPPKTRRKADSTTPHLPGPNLKSTEPQDTQ